MKNVQEPGHTAATSTTPGTPFDRRPPGAGPLLEEGAAFEALTGRDEHAPAANGHAAARDGGRHEVIVIGGGQAGLSAGYHLSRLGVPFVILDAHARVGDAWRQRWDSLRLFTPAQFDGLDGLPFPAPAGTFPTKDEMADYLEGYSRHFALPVRTGVRVDRLEREGGRYVVTAGETRYEAAHVIVAMANYQQPWKPDFAGELSAGIAQVHSFDYRSPAQVPDGDVLVVGGGNSGAEIGLELARAGRRVWFSGRDVGEIPFDVTSRIGANVLAPVVLRGVFHRLLTLDTPVGRRARPEVISKGGPLIRTKWRHLAARGARRVPRLNGVRAGLPLLADGRTLDVKSVVWCTGFRPGFSWLRLPVFDHEGEPRQRRGVAGDEPGLYFVGLHFQYAMSSTMVHGVGRDARYVAETVAARVGAARA